MMLYGWRPIGAKEVCKPEPRRLTAEELSEGEWVAGILTRGDTRFPFSVGRIHKVGNDIWACQDVADGTITPDRERYHFNFSWFLNDPRYYTELYRIPEPPTFKVGDRVVRTKIGNMKAFIYNGEIGDKGKIVTIDEVFNDDGLLCRITWERIHRTHWTEDGTYKLLPTETCIPVEAKAEYEYTVDPTMANVLKGLLKTKTITPEATVKLRTATHGPASRTTLEVDKSIFPLSDIKGINAALKPYGLHMQKSGHKKKGE
jgi:hypothetical protein